LEIGWKSSTVTEGCVSRSKASQRAMTHTSVHGPTSIPFFTSKIKKSNRDNDSEITTPSKQAGKSPISNAATKPNEIEIENEHPTINSEDYHITFDQ